MTDFWQMGGYALYVWPSYALFLAIVVYWLVVPWLEVKRTLRKMKQRKRRQHARANTGEQHESQA